MNSEYQQRFDENYLYVSTFCLAVVLPNWTSFLESLAVKLCMDPGNTSAARQDQRSGGFALFFKKTFEKKVSRSFVDLIYVAPSLGSV